MHRGISGDPSRCMKLLQNNRTQIKHKLQYLLYTNMYHEYTTMVLLSVNFSEIQKSKCTECNS